MRHTAPSLTEPDFEPGDSSGFWRWYVRNAELLKRLCLETGPDRPFPEDVIHAFGDTLLHYHPGLAFEMGIDEDGLHDLVISAEGVSSVFPVVIELVHAAPPMPGHMVTAFRQRKGTGVSIGGRTVTPEDVRYESEADEDAGRLHVVLYLPVPPEVDDRARMQLGFLLLDGTLGEYDVATCLGKIEFKSMSETAAEGHKPLTELVAEVDALARTKRPH